MNWHEFDTPYDGARHPDVSDPAAHDDVPPIVWREWQAQRRCESTSYYAAHDPRVPCQRPAGHAGLHESPQTGPNGFRWGSANQRRVSSGDAPPPEGADGA